MASLDELEPRYGTILCDIWGCIHDGVRVFPGVADRMERWREKAKRVILVTNAPRGADRVEAYLKRLGLDEALWHGIATAGDAGIAALLEMGEAVAIIGTEHDRHVLEEKGVRIADSADCTQVACAGLDEERSRVADYEEEIRALAERDVLMHCLNPDRWVRIGDRLVQCAGALADRYEELGGKVEWYGKPYPAIYEHAMRLAGRPERKEVLAIGDGLLTDVLGAARMGFDCVFVTGGIGRGQAFPPGFAQSHGLGDWKPVAVVGGLG